MYDELKSPLRMIRYNNSTAILALPIEIIVYTSYTSKYVLSAIRASGVYLYNSWCFECIWLSYGCKCEMIFDSRRDWE